MKLSLILFASFSRCSAFQNLRTPRGSSSLAIRSSIGSRTCCFATPQPAEDDEEYDEEIEPGKMRVSEIKAELDLRGIDYSDCFDKESLSERLQKARLGGKANPEILDRFNKAKLEETFGEKKVEINDEDLEKAVANDGTLPGGMDPEMFKSLMANPEVMAMLQNPKMQEAMKIMMSEGQPGLEKAMAADPEMTEIIKNLNSIVSFM